MARNLEHIFQATIMKEHLLRHYINSGKSIRWYPLVKKIGDDKLISQPDLIIVEKDNNIVTGYEFKYLNNKKAHENYKSLYSGLGQIQLYFYYGVERAILIIGVSKKVDEHVFEKLKQIASAIDTINKVSNSSYFGINIFHDETKIFRVIPTGQNGTLSRFPIKNPLVKKNYEDIIKGNLTKDKIWLKKFQLPFFE